MQVEPSRGSWGRGPPAAVPVTSPLCSTDLQAGAQALAAPISSVGPQHPSGFWQKCEEHASPGSIHQLIQEWGHCLSSQEVMEEAGQILKQVGEEVSGQLWRRPHGPLCPPKSQLQRTQPSTRHLSV